MRLWRLSSACVMWPWPPCPSGSQTLSQWIEGRSAEEHSNLVPLSWDRPTHGQLVMPQHNSGCTELILISHTHLDGSHFGAIKGRGKLEPQASVWSGGHTAAVQSTWLTQTLDCLPKTLALRAVQVLTRGNSSIYDSQIIPHQQGNRTRSDSRIHALTHLEHL